MRPMNILLVFFSSSVYINLQIIICLFFKKEMTIDIAVKVTRKPPSKTRYSSKEQRQTVHYIYSKTANVKILQVRYLRFLNQVELLLKKIYGQRLN